jgi:AcrR family transcriptional regulator
MNGLSPHTAFRRELRASAMASALERLNAEGWNNVRMADIAADVGVSRPTLYAEFGKKEGLGEALVAHEAERFLLGAMAALRSNGQDPVAAVRMAAEFILGEAATSVIVNALLVPDTGGEAATSSLLNSLSTASSVVLPDMYEGLLGWFSEQCPNTDRARLVQAVDALIRLVVSYAFSPGPGSVSDAADSIAMVAASLLPELATT